MTTTSEGKPIVSIKVRLLVTDKGAELLRARYRDDDKWDGEDLDELGMEVRQAFGNGATVCEVREVTIIAELLKTTQAMPASFEGEGQVILPPDVVQRMEEERKKGGDTRRSYLEQALLMAGTHLLDNIPPGTYEVYQTENSRGIRRVRQNT